jgi:hypothetical protein
VVAFDFFSWDSLRAGWYLSWRILLRMLAAFVVVGIAAAVLGQVLVVLSAVTFIVGGLGVLIWSAVLVPKIASQWAQERYGQPLTQWWSVWWGIGWRSFAVSVVATVILGVPSGVAMAFQSAYANTPLAALGGLIVGLVGIANSIVGFLGTGWAMSRVAVEQIGGVALAVTPVVRPVPRPVVPVAPDPVPAATASAPAPRSSPVVSAPPPPSTAGKYQCPKCGLYETERGSVIGWYCKVCGWREARR